MSELTREERICKIMEELAEISIEKGIDKLNYRDAERILDAIDPPGIVPGMWGKFWDNDGETSEYGELMHIEQGETTGRIFLAKSDNYYDNFLRIPGLKEAIEKLEADLESN